MQLNTTREKLARGETVLGCGLQCYRSAEIPRTYAAAGFDYVFLDMEHGSYDLETVQDMIRSSSDAGITPVVRVGELLYSLVARLLEPDFLGCGFAFSLGLLFHSFFIEWTEVIISRDGIGLRPVGHAWLNRQPRLVPWERVHGMNQVITREGGHLEIAAESKVVRVDRALFRPDTFASLCAAIAQRTRQWGAAAYDEELAAAA